MKGCESSASLVKEKKIDQHSWPKDSGDTSEESGEETRDDEAVELIFVNHKSSPYLCEQASN